MHYEEWMSIAERAVAFGGFASFPATPDLIQGLLRVRGKSVIPGADRQRVAYPARPRMQSPCSSAIALAIPCGLVDGSGSEDYRPIAVRGSYVHDLRGGAWSAISHQLVCLSRLKWRRAHS
jgi:hypothetical protein